MRHRRARRYVVRVSEGGGLRLTLPRGASIAAGVAFAERQRDWIVHEMERQRQRRWPWVTGTRVWFRGEHAPIDVSESIAVVGSETIPLESSEANVRATVEGRLRALATTELPARCRELANDAGVDVSKVSVRKQRSRWGACSARRMITLNWRLIQMPSEVRDCVILPGLTHIQHPNHSRRVWREVERICVW